MRYFERIRNEAIYINTFNHAFAWINFSKNLILAITPFRVKLQIPSISLFLVKGERMFPWKGKAQFVYKKNKTSEPETSGLVPGVSPGRMESVIMKIINFTKWKEKCLWNNKIHFSSSWLFQSFIYNYRMCCRSVDNL